MENAFLVLLRCYVRIDHVLLRSIETRYMGYLRMPKMPSEAAATEKFSILKEICVKEYMWKSMNSIYEDFQYTEEEWQTIQSQPDYICTKIPILYERKFKLML
jgi:TIP41-like family